MLHTLLINCSVVQLNIVISDHKSWKKLIDMTFDDIIANNTCPNSRQEFWITGVNGCFLSVVSFRELESIATKQLSMPSSHLYQQFVLLPWPPCDDYNQLKFSLSQKLRKMNDIAPLTEALKYYCSISIYRFDLSCELGNNFREYDLAVAHKPLMP